MQVSERDRTIANLQRKIDHLESQSDIPREHVVPIRASLDQADYVEGERQDIEAMHEALRRIADEVCFSK